MGGLFSSSKEFQIPFPRDGASRQEFDEYAKYANLLENTYLKYGPAEKALEILNSKYTGKFKIVNFRNGYKVVANENPAPKAVAPAEYDKKLDDVFRYSPEQGAYTGGKRQKSKSKKTKSTSKKTKKRRA